LIKHYNDNLAQHLGRIHAGKERAKEAEEKAKKEQEEKEQGTGDKEQGENKIKKDE
jgi:hypothetical protein